MYAKHKNQFFLYSKKICLFVLISAFLFILMIPAVSFANNIIEENENLLDKLDSTNDNADFLLKNPVAEKKKLNKLGAESNYLCLKPSNAGQSASFQIKRYFEPSGKDFWYSYDLSEWKKVFESDDYSQVQTVDFTIDKPIYFKGNNPNGFSRNADGNIFNYMFVIKSEYMDASGSVMSLLDNGTGTMTTIPNDYCFDELFGTPTSLECSTKLLSAPELPAVELKSNCYQAMFCNCSSLKSAPYLPAENLVSECYASMFQECSSLSYIKVNFRDWNTDEDCTIAWTTGVNQDTDNLFICPPELDATQRGESSIPNNWTVVTDINAHADVSSYSSQYDGGSHGVSVSNIYPDKATVTYSFDGINYSEDPITRTDVGFTFVYIKIHRDHFNDYITNATIEIKPKEGATASVGTKEKYYGHEDPTYDVAFTNIEGNTPVLGTDYILEREKGESVKVNDGTYEVKLHWIRDNNYDLSITNGTLKIKKANDLKLVANPASKVEGAVDPDLTAHMEGLKFDDSFDPTNYDYYQIKQVTESNATITLQPELTDAGKAFYGRNYDVTVTGFAQTSTLTVYTAAGEQAFTYTTNAFNINYNGLENEFKVNVNNPPAGMIVEYKTSQEGTYSRTAPKFKNADTYTVYFRISAAGYSTVETSQQVKINPAPATLVADYSCIYKNVGEADPALNATLYGAVGGEKLVKDTDYFISRTAGEDAGSYDISLSAVSGTDTTKNYQIQVVPAKFFVLGSGDVPPAPPTPPTPPSPGGDPTFINSIIAQTGDVNFTIVIALIVVACACGVFVVYRKLRKK